ncbi:glycosyltransferase [bacterium]|nr:glycosyltransferase [bacterium]MDA7906143.1 glycosyltransferase [Mariniblastus sp.]MDA7925615.1 glycosyltransferase [Mariniblastus sp.]MDB4458670.1 glycosyltransferase [bacterium]MDC3223887.1 glycosyltransferase [Mariniblastus sp.]
MNYRILFTIESLFELGPVEELKILTGALSARGCEIHIAILGEHRFEPNQWLESGIKVHVLNKDDRTPLHSLRDCFSIVPELRKLIHNLSPDLVHAWCGQAEILTLIATRNVPLTRQLPFKHLISTQLAIPRELGFRHQIFENYLGDDDNFTTVVPHASIKTKLIELGKPEAQIEIIANSAAPQQVSEKSSIRKSLRKQLGLAKDSYLAGTVAPLVHRSRLKDLIWATDLLTCVRPDFHFLIIGSGSQLSRLQRFASLTEAGDHIHFLSHPESPVIQGLDFYWHPHLQEPISGNLMSAMAAEIPSIAVYGEGTEEIIRHQETGFAVNFGARDEFARWTKFLIEKPQESHILAKQGRLLVERAFPIESMINDYLALYDRKLESI